MRTLKPALLLTALLCSCGSTQTGPSNEALKRYKLHGEIVRLDAEGKLAIVRHQRIDGWMEAMTMTFPVKEAPDFTALHPNDCIDATVFVQGDSFWIGEITHQNAEPGMCVQAPPAPPASK